MFFNLEYIFVKSFIFFRESYYFLRDAPWSEIIFWLQIAGGVITVICVAGIIYNLIGIVKGRKAIEEQEL